MTKTVSYTNVHLTYTADLAGLRQAKSDMAAMNRVINQAKTDTQKYEEHVQKLDRLLANGKISQEQYNRALDAAKTKFLGAAQSAKSYASTLSQLGGPMALLGMGGVAVAGVGIGAGVRGIKDSVRAYADLEATLISLGVVYGDDARAAKDFAKFREMAAVSPLETRDFTRSAQVMAQYGVAIDDIIPRLEAISEVAAGDSEKMATLSLAFGQVAANGRLMGQEVLQMVNAGFNPLAEIARTTGRNMQDLRKDMEKGLITFDMVAGAFDSATEAGGRFFGMNEKLGKSVNAQLAQLRDEVTKLKEAIGALAAQDLVLDPLKNGIAGLSSYVTRLKDDFLLMNLAEASVRSKMRSALGLPQLPGDLQTIAGTAGSKSGPALRTAEELAKIQKDTQSKLTGMLTTGISSVPKMIGEAGQTYADAIGVFEQRAREAAQDATRASVEQRAKEVEARKRAAAEQPKEMKVDIQSPQALMARTQEAYRQIFGKQNTVAMQQLEEQKLARMANEKAASSLERLESKPSIGVME